MLGSAEIELLLGAGCVAEVHSAGVALTGLAPRWREARQSGSPRVVEWSEGTFVAALEAAAVGADSFLWPSGVGTDLPAVNPWLKVTADPHTGASVLAVRALEPDVAVLHVPGVDADGNVLRRRRPGRRRAARPRRPPRDRHVRARRPDRAGARRDLAPLRRRRRRGAARGGPHRMPAPVRRRRCRAGVAVIADLLTAALAEEVAATVLAAGLRADDAGDRGRREGGAGARAPGAGARSRVHRPRRRPARVGARRVHAAAAGAPRGRGRPDPARRGRPDEPLRHRAAGPAEDGTDRPPGPAGEQRHAVAALVPPARALAPHARRAGRHDLRPGAFGPGPAGAL